jgi:hypothetical protein
MLVSMGYGGQEDTIALLRVRNSIFVQIVHVFASVNLRLRSIHCCKVPLPPETCYEVLYQRP